MKRGVLVLLAGKKNWCVCVYVRTPWGTSVLIWSETATDGWCGCRLRWAGAALCPGSMSCRVAEFLGFPLVFLCELASANLLWSVLYVPLLGASSFGGKKRRGERYKSKRDPGPNNWSSYSHRLKHSTWFSFPFFFFFVILNKNQVILPCLRFICVTVSSKIFVDIETKRRLLESYICISVVGYRINQLADTILIFAFRFERFEFVSLKRKKKQLKKQSENVTIKKEVCTEHWY